MIAVTGASGHLGRLVVEQLLAAGVAPANIAALVRTPSKSSDLAARGVVVREADYKRPDTLVRALAGIEKLLLVSSNDFDDRAGQHRNVLEAAKKAGVAHIAYTSILRGTESPLILGHDHAVTERALVALGVPYTLLRNGWYFENYFGDLQGTLAHGVAGASGEGRVSGASRGDYAAAAVTVLTTAGHENKTYELAGDGSFTKAELAAELSRQAGKPVPYAALDADSFGKLLAGAGLPPPVAAIFVDADVQTAKGALFDDSRTLSRLIGRPTTSLADAIRAALAG